MMMLLAILATSALAQHPTLPNPKLTPGKTNPAVTQATIRKTICVEGYTKTIRDVTEAEKKQVMQRYGLPEAELHSVEIDHFISLEIGGSNEIENLWPQYYEPEPGARQKDVVEDYLHKQVCTGRLTLAAAQRQIRSWVAVYRQIHR